MSQRPLKVALNTTHVVLPHEHDWVKNLPVWFPWVSLTDSLAEADVILHTFFDEEWRDYPDAIAVEYVWENVAPDFNHADYAISFSRLTYGDRHLRYPLFCFLPEFHALFAEDGTVIPFDAHAEAAAKTCFCTAVVSNPNRDGACARLFDLLSAHKPVASGGKWRNSFGGKRVDDKRAFLRMGKFTLACENSAVPDYVTEKIVDAFAARTVPIYWGAPNVAEDFNPAAFIDCSKFPSLEAVVEEVRRLDADDAAYEAMLAAPLFKDGRCPEAFRAARLRDFFANIFSQPKESAKRRSRQARAEIIWSRSRLATPLVAHRWTALAHAAKLFFSKRYRSYCRRIGI